MKAINFVNARNERFRYDTKNVRNASLNNLQLVMECKLLANPDFDLTSIYIILSINSKGNRILDYSVLLTYKIDGWGNFISKATTEDIKNTSEVRKMIEISTGFIRGALYAKEKNTPVENYNMPIIDIESLIKRTEIILPDKM